MLQFYPLDSFFTILDHFDKHLGEKRQKTESTTKSSRNTPLAGETVEIAKKQELLRKAVDLASLIQNVFTLDIVDMLEKVSISFD